MFLRFLDYKLAELGKMLVKIDQWFASSKTHHVCEYVHEKLTLNIWKWDPPICQTVHDRDENAAQNIKTEGMRIVFV